KRSPCFYIAPHEYREHLIGPYGILDGDPYQRPPGRIHGCRPKLFGVHLAQALVALYGDAFLPFLVDEREELFLGSGADGAVLVENPYLVLIIWGCPLVDTI